MLTKRQNRILKLVIEADDSLSSTSLAAQLNVSKRTIIKDIQSINASELLLCSSSHGYYLNPESKEEATRILSLDGDNADTATAVLKSLLIRNSPISIDEITGQYFISPSLLQKYLGTINARFKSYGISVNRRNNMICLDGKEEDRRRLMAYLIHRESDAFFSDITNLSGYFPGISIEMTSKRLNEVLQKYQFHVREYYTVNFLINVLVILSRSPFEKGIAEHHGISDSSYPEQQMSSDIVRFAELDNGIRYSDYSATAEEINHILYGFVEDNSSINSVSHMHYLHGEFADRMRKILRQVFDYYFLSINYESFLNVFCLHVAELIKRCRYTMNFRPASLSIKHTDPFVYEVAVRLANEIGKEFDIEIPDSEINLIAIHIGYAINQAEQDITKAEIVIISDDYHGITDKIRDQIEIMYEHTITIAGTYRTLADVPMKLASSSFLISTSTPASQPFQICYISPFFSLADQKKLTEELTQYQQRLKNREFTKLFYQYVDPSSFLVLSQPMDKFDAIHILSSMAINAGDVYPDFEKHVLEREKISSTAFYHDFAIPHANVEIAKRTRLYIMVNKSGITWDDQTIHLVFLIVIDHSTSKEFKKLYSSIIEVLYHNKDIQNNLSRISTINDFIQCFGQRY